MGLLIEKEKFDFEKTNAMISVVQKGLSNYLAI
jgi:hypothetical protein